MDEIKPMPLPDHVTAKIRRSLHDLLGAELGAGAGALQEAMRPMLQRAFVYGINLGVSLTAAASGQGIETLRQDLTDELGIVPPPITTAPRPARQARVARGGKSGKPRAAAGAVGQAIDLVLADQPGSRIVEVQDLAVQLDPSISRTSVANELRRYIGKRYRQEGKRWFRIGDTEKGEAEAGSLAYGAEPLAEESKVAAATLDFSAGRAA